MTVPPAPPSSPPPDEPGTPGSPARHVLLGRRLLLGGGLAALGVAAVSIASGRLSPARESVLRVGRTGKGGYDVVMRAAHVEPSGFQLVYNDFQSGHLQVEALNGGSLDFGSMSEIPPVFAAASSIQSFRQIATIH